MTPDAEIDPLTAEEQPLAERLRRGRAVPAAGFRGALRRHLDGLDPGHGPRPEHLRLIASGCLGASALLLALGALQAAGAL